MNQAPEFLTPQQVKARWNGATTTGTLANWRAQKKGPAYQKFGSRVRYPLAALQEYEAANMVSVVANENKNNGNSK